MTTTAPACQALYVHVPFCRTLCGYCDFYSQVLEPAAVGPLVDALLCELDGYVAPGRPTFDTIYVGGGTPTVLPTFALGRLLSDIRRYAAPVATAPDTEFTVEANPATVTDAVADLLARHGVTRVSVGAQSFSPAELRVLDRTHRPEQVGQTVTTCRRVGLRRISLDLIFGIPGQTLASWLETLRAALALEPEHLSCYGLTYEPGTPLHERLQAGHVQRVDPDLEADMYEAARDILPVAGLRQYEISNFARPGAECRHNLRYWHNEPYLGIGPGAAGFVDEEAPLQPPSLSGRSTGRVWLRQPPSLSGRGQGRVRYKNVADTAAYVAAIAAGRSPRIEEERLPPDRRARETAMLELRLTAGIDRRRFAERYGQDPAELFADAITKHSANGCLEVDFAVIRLTRRGLLLADTVITDFL